ncbi:hypothetical protein LCGC14_1873400 [marine sediment metagenome]|uniref:Uncharacterized protein n=1 Tax=marine sediment metagenome TaxID=412755 RepID=A0A0F9J325_9ZZZZ
MRITTLQRMEGEILPPFCFGYCYRDFDAMIDHFYLIPFNFIIRMVIDIKYRWDYFRGNPSRVDIQIYKGIHEHLKQFELNIDKAVNRRIEAAIRLSQEQMKGVKLK